MKSSIKILLLLFIAQLSLSAQSSSSYTRLGIGNIDYTYSASRLGMGGLGTAVAVPNYIDLINPAAWYKLNLTRFITGMTYNGVVISNSTTKEFNGHAQFNGFTFGFPVDRGLGISAAIGLVPYSSVSYMVYQPGVSPSGDQYKTVFQGSGGLSKAFVGASYRLPFDLVVGATFNYYFGELDYRSEVQFGSTSNITTSFKTKYNPAGLGTTIGLLSPDLSPLFNSKSLSDFRLGFSVDYAADFNTDTILTSSSILRTDTVGQGTTTMKIPARFAAGLSFMLNQKYLLSLDMASQPWQNYSLAGEKSYDLRNALKLSAGFEYRPKVEMGTGFWEQIIWRLGLSYEQTQYNIFNNGINAYSVAGGCSIPLGYENTIDFGIRYMIRGSSDSNLIKENGVQIDLGLSIGQLWFLRHEN